MPCVYSLKNSLFGPLLSISISRELFLFSSENFCVNLFNNFLLSDSIIIWRFQLVRCTVSQTDSILTRTPHVNHRTQSGLSDCFLTSFKDGFIQYHSRYIREKLIDNTQWISGISRLFLKGQDSRYFSCCEPGGKNWGYYVGIYVFI